jgi:hypothetical protein
MMRKISQRGTHILKAIQGETGWKRKGKRQIEGYLQTGKHKARKD